MRTYVDDYGIGPWEVYEFNAGNTEDFREPEDGIVIEGDDL